MILPGKVRTVIPTADRQKATVKVRISFTEDDHKKLRDPALDPRILPDMGVKVTFLEEDQKRTQTAEEKQKQVEVLAVVPQNTIHTDGTTKFVLVLKDGKVERHAVKLGATHGSDVEILAGIQTGAQVIAKGPEGLTDGQEVQLKQ